MDCYLEEPICQRCPFLLFNSYQSLDQLWGTLSILRLSFVDCLVHSSIYQYLSNYVLRSKLFVSFGVGIAVVGVMFSTTLLMFLVITAVWKKSVYLALAFLVIFGSVECVYYSAVLFKVQQGGWVPLAIAVTVLTVMYVWHYGTVKRYEYEIQNKVSVGWVLGLAQGLGLVRVPGVGLVYTDLAHGVPPILSHFITNLPAMHSILCFVCIKYLPVNTVHPYERFHVKRIGPKSFSMFRCAARYGYMDLHKKDDDFEQELIAELARYIKYEEAENPEMDSSSTVPGDWTSIETSVETPIPPQDSIINQQRQQQLQTVMSTGESSGPSPVVGLPLQSSSSSPYVTSTGNRYGFDFTQQGEANGIASPELQAVSSSVTSSSEDLFSSKEGPSRAARLRGGRPLNHAIGEIGEESLNELDQLKKNMDSGIVYLLGNIQVRARQSSGFLKKLTINWIYAFLRKTCRENLVIYKVPHENLLQVGMVYYV
jgi:hypothetical protein